MCQNSLAIWPFLPQTKQLRRGLFVKLFFFTFFKLTMVLKSAHTIYLYWGIIWRFTSFTTCATSTNQVCNLRNSFSKYTCFFKGFWVLLKMLMANNWLQSMDESIQYFIISNTMHFFLNKFCSFYVTSDRILLYTCS